MSKINPKSIELKRRTGNAKIGVIGRKSASLIFLNILNPFLVFLLLFFTEFLEFMIKISIFLPNKPFGGTVNILK